MSSNRINQLTGFLRARLLIIRHTNKRHEQKLHKPYIVSRTVGKPAKIFTLFSYL